jgi:tetratricopeptide (TPR) repeat protein
MLKKCFTIFGKAKKPLAISPLLMLALLAPSYSALAVYESSQNEVANFNIDDSQSNLKLARIEQAKGKLTEAVFALERAVAIDPNNTEAQFLLGEVYAELGEKDSAEAQFVLVVKAKGEQSASAQTALDNLKYVRAWSHQAAVGLRLGHDDNINSGLDSTSIFLPSTNSIATLPDSTKPQDKITQTVYASGSLRYQHTDKLAYVFKGTLAKTDDNFYNQAYVAIDAGVHLSYENYQHSFNVIQSYLDYNNVDKINSTRFNFEHLQQVAGGNYYKVDVDIQALDYETQNIRDDRRVIVTGLYSHALSPTLNIRPSVYVSRDVRGEDTFEHLDYDSYGLKASLDKQLSHALKLTLGIDYIVSDHDQQDPTFLRNRSDKRMRLHSKLSWTLAQATTLSAAYQNTQSDSNIALHDIDKNVFFINIAKTF